MPALNFQARFAPLVESGEKRQTIRALRKRPIQKGDTLYLYTGMRHRGARLLRTAVCRQVLPIQFERMPWGQCIILDSEVLSLTGRAARRLAKRDGFRSVGELLEFFESLHGFPFSGQVIRW